MSINQEKQLEVFIAYIIDFNKLKNSVSDLIKNGTDQDLKRVQTMYGYISDYVENSTSVDDILDRVNGIPVQERLMKLVKYLNMILTKDKDAAFQKLQQDFKALDHLIEEHHITRNVNEIFEEDLISSDPTVPISPENLNFLNEIAKLSMENVKLMQEAERNFKTLTFRNKIKDLYSRNLFYFEQVYSNADVRIQKKILHIIEEHHQMIDPTEEDKEALQSLQDIGILSDIDNLAIKSKSNVTDHQAFEAFCKILRKNKNVKLMNKILRENIIMTSMFKTNSSTIGEHYGLRKMFISARYPHNQRIIQRYMQLMEKNEAEMGLIFKLLRKDMQFNKAYETYIKSKDTVEFKKFVVDLLKQLEDGDTTSGSLESLTFVVKSFIYMDKHDKDVMSQEDVFEYLNRIYYYIFKNEIYQMDHPLNEEINKFALARLNSFLRDKVNLYQVDDKAVVYGITPGDIWYHINLYMKRMACDHIDKVYLKYNEINGYEFQVGKPLNFLGKKMGKISSDSLGNNEALIICADVDKKNHEIYFFGLCGRIVKALNKGKIKTQLSSVEGGMFRKKVTPGLEKEVDIAIRKLFYNLMTYIFMIKLDPDLFAEIYKKKVERMLDEMYNINISQEAIEQFVDVQVIDLVGICNKKDILRLKDKRKTFNYKTTTEEYMEHAKNLFKLFAIES